MIGLPAGLWWQAPLVLLVLGVLYFLYLLNKPKKMTETTLPNGMKVWQWQQGETDYLYKEIFQDLLYARNDLKLNAGSVVFDVGANIGMFALFCHNKTKGDLTCYSFEPMPKIHAVCTRNAERYGKGNLKVFNCGLSSSEANVEFEFHPNFSLWSTADPKFDDQRLARLHTDLPAIMRSGSKNIFVRGLVALFMPLMHLFLSKVLGKTEKVPCHLRTMSQVIDEQNVSRIDLLKVDVEGHEIEVLQGITKDAHWAMIQQVVMEVETFALVEKVRGILENKGFTVKSFASERESMGEAITSEVSCVTAVRA